MCFMCCAFKIIALFALKFPIEGSGKPIHLYNVTAKPGDYPWEVSLQIETFGHFCVGTLIALDYILTTASCLIIGLQILRVYGRVVAGDMLGDANQRTQRQTRNFVKLFLHPQYDCLVNSYNIALIKVHRPFVKTKHVQPAVAALHTPSPYTSCDLAGWIPPSGQLKPTSDVEPQTRGLKRGKFTVLYNEACGYSKVQRDFICLKYHLHENSICPRFQGAGLTCGGVLYGVYTGPRKCSQLEELYQVSSVPFHKEFISLARQDNLTNWKAQQYDSFNTTSDTEMYVAYSLVPCVILIVMYCVFCSKSKGTS